MESKSSPALPHKVCVLSGGPNHCLSALSLTIPNPPLSLSPPAWGMPPHLLQPSLPPFYPHLAITNSSPLRHQCKGHFSKLTHPTPPQTPNPHTGRVRCLSCTAPSQSIMLILTWYFCLPTRLGVYEGRNTCPLQSAFPAFRTRPGPEYAPHAGSRVHSFIHSFTYAINQQLCGDSGEGEIIFAQF